jgi:hypothetical protein
MAFVIGLISPEHVLQRIRERRLICGLRNSAKPTSDILTPQETSPEDAADMGAEGADLSCPGSGVVADRDCEI